MDGMKFAKMLSDKHLFELDRIRIHRPLDAAARRGADSGCGPGGKAGIRRRIHKRKSSGEQAASACSLLLLL